MSGGSAAVPRADGVAEGAGGHPLGGVGKAQGGAFDPKVFGLDRAGKLLRSLFGRSEPEAEAGPREPVEVVRAKASELETALIANRDGADPSGAGVKRALHALLAPYQIVPATRRGAQWVVGPAPGDSPAPRYGNADTRAGDTWVGPEFRDDAIEFLARFREGTLSDAPNLARLSHSMHALIHEEIHHATPVDSRRTSVASKLEEITTELTARQITRESFGLGGTEQLAAPSNTLDYNETRAYDGEILELTDALSEVTGLPWPQAKKRIEEAALAYRSQPNPGLTAQAQAHGNFLDFIPGLNEAQRATLIARMDPIEGGSKLSRVKRQLAEATKNRPGLPTLDPAAYGFTPDLYGISGGWTRDIELNGKQYRLIVNPRVEIGRNGEKILHLDRTALIPPSGQKPDSLVSRVPTGILALAADLRGRFGSAGWDDVQLHFRRGLGSNSTSARDDGALRTYSLMRREGGDAEATTGSSGGGFRDNVRRLFGLRGARAQAGATKGSHAEDEGSDGAEELAAARPRQAFPFAEGADGKLSPAKDASAFHGGPEPTEATLSEFTGRLLDYFGTGQFGEFEGQGGVPIRYVVFAPPQGVKVRGVVNFFEGTGESMLNYEELFYNLRHQREAGFVIACADHRGQGFSGREVPDVTHVHNSRDFARDQWTFRNILRGLYGDDIPYTAVGHSLGGAIAADYGQTHPGDYQRFALGSPALGLKTDVNDRFARNVTSAAASSGLAASPALGQTREYSAPAFEDNIRTTSRARFDAKLDTYEAFPETKTGGVTFGWADQVYGLGDRVMEPNRLARLRDSDVHLFIAEGERRVDVSRLHDFAEAVGVVPARFPGEHEIFQGPDSVRQPAVERLQDIIEDRPLANPDAVAAAIPAEDVMLEQMSYEFAYQSPLSGPAQALLAKWGYHPQPVIYEGVAGVRMMVFLPAKGSSARPVVAFRGSKFTEIVPAFNRTYHDAMTQARDHELGPLGVVSDLVTKGTVGGRPVTDIVRDNAGMAGDGLKHLLADTEPGIGQIAFDRNQELIKQVLNSLQPAVVTGYSLGGAIAQITAARMAGKISRVVLFNSPGVTERDVDTFTSQEERPEVVHHRTERDPVSTTGQQHLPGSTYNHNPRNDIGWFESHRVAMLLSPQFRAQREQLGLDDATLAELERAKGTPDSMILEQQAQRREAHPVDKSEVDPSESGRGIETVRRIVAGTGVRERVLVPLVRMIEGKPTALPSSVSPRTTEKVMDLGTVYDAAYLRRTNTVLEGIDQVDLMGGPMGTPGFFNVDLHASRGLRADIADLPQLIKPHSVSLITVNNPAAPYLEVAAGLLKHGGKLIVRGTAWNRYVTALTLNTADKRLADQGFAFTENGPAAESKNRFYADDGTAIPPDALHTYSLMYLRQGTDIPNVTPRSSAVDHEAIAQTGPHEPTTGAPSHQPAAEQPDGALSAAKRREHIMLASQVARASKIVFEEKTINPGTPEEDYQLLISPIKDGSPLNQFAYSMWKSMGLECRYSATRAGAGAEYDPKTKTIMVPRLSLVFGMPPPFILKGGQYHEALHARPRRGIFAAEIVAKEAGEGQERPVLSGLPKESPYAHGMRLDEIATYSEGAAISIRELARSAKSRPGTVGVELAEPFLLQNAEDGLQMSTVAEQTIPRVFAALERPDNRVTYSNTSETSMLRGRSITTETTRMNIELEGSVVSIDLVGPEYTNMVARMPASEPELHEALVTRVVELYNAAKIAKGEFQRILDVFKARQAPGSGGWTEEELKTLYDARKQLNALVRPEYRIPEAERPDLPARAPSGQGDHNEPVAVEASDEAAPAAPSSRMEPTARRERIAERAQRKLAAQADVHLSQYEQAWVKMRREAMDQREEGASFGNWQETVNDDGTVHAERRQRWNRANGPLIYAQKLDLPADPVVQDALRAAMSAMSDVTAQKDYLAYDLLTEAMRLRKLDGLSPSAAVQKELMLRHQARGDLPGLVGNRPRQGTRAERVRAELSDPVGIDRIRESNGVLIDKSPDLFEPHGTFPHAVQMDYLRQTLSPDQFKTFIGYITTDPKGMKAWVAILDHQGDFSPLGPRGLRELSRELIPTERTPGVDRRMPPEGMLAPREIRFERISNHELLITSMPRSAGGSEWNQVAYSLNLSMDVSIVCDEAAPARHWAFAGKRVTIGPDVLKNEASSEFIEFLIKVQRGHEARHAYLDTQGTSDSASMLRAHVRAMGPESRPVPGVEGDLYSRHLAFEEISTYSNDMAALIGFARRSEARLEDLWRRTQAAGSSAERDQLRRETNRVLEEQEQMQRYIADKSAIAVRLSEAVARNVGSVQDVVGGNRPGMVHFRTERRSAMRGGRISSAEEVVATIQLSNDHEVSITLAGPEFVGQPEAQLMRALAGRCDDLVATADQAADQFRQIGAIFQRGREWASHIEELSNLRSSLSRLTRRADHLPMGAGAGSPADDGSGH
jgi:lysophospholipase